MEKYDSPFTNIHTEGISGLFDDEGVEMIFKILDDINDNAVA